GGTDTTGGWDGDPADDPVWGNVSTAGLSTIGGATWWDRYTSSGSFVMGTDLDAMQFGNQNDADAFGNAMDNNMLGNDGANRLEGGAGDDRIFGREGNDTLLGDGGNDVIEGAGGNDLLYGGAGNDSLLGGNGNDTLLASIGNDTLDGQNDADTALFGGPLSSYGITQSSATTFTVSDATSTVLVKNIETFVFDGQTVSAANLMTAHAAAVGGTGGTDTTGGTGGTDTTGGTGGTDTTGGTGGTDTTGGTGGTDTTGGSAGTDVYPVAGVWSETSPGNAPVLNGIAGTVDYGRMGVSYVMGPDLDHGRFDNDNNLSVWGNALNNDINGNDGHNRIEGRAGNDTLDGYDGNDTIIGGLGNDKLEGDRDNDLLHGGSGNDTLDGGRGNDVFVFLTGGGSDRIADFGDGSDTLWLGVNGVYTVTQALTHAVETGGDVVFTFGADVLRIDDVTVADIQSHITIL
ncbi:MAG: hypothetical protein KDK26_13000, partial [Roseivivax sp.]|nr:hypothetical protein [Roseivivax sp.]